MKKQIVFATFVLIMLMCIAGSEQSFVTTESRAGESAAPDTDPDAELLELRNEIDIINKELLVLLNKRAKVVLEIGELKKANSMKVYDPGREKQIENKIVELNTGPLPNESVIKIFREIISASRELQ